MNDLDRLSDRLEGLAERAPMSATDPAADIRRGQQALRRRRTRGAAGIATAAVAIGVVSGSIYVSAGEGPEDTWAGGTVVPHIEVGSNAVSGLCIDEAGGRGSSDAGEESAPAASPRPPWEHPAVASQLASYQQATAAVLDPSGAQLGTDAANIQFACDATSGRLALLGAKFGWSSGGGLGVVQLEVIAAEHDEARSQIVPQHEQWTALEQNLPADVIEARSTEYQDGRAVSVRREDGLTVTVDTNGTWGNNSAPGAPPVTDLPATEELLKLAASGSLTLPE